MALQMYPYWTVLASSTTYSVLLASILPNTADGVKKAVKQISSLHSASTTILALYILKYGQWPIDSQSGDSSKREAVQAINRLDDSSNPMISGKSAIANALTAWETGYLIYDTGALYLQARARLQQKNTQNSMKALLQDSPVFLAHHVALISALGYLQTYIASGREKGVWVIVAFLLMNASNPFLHIRWALKKKYGYVSNRYDILLAAVFAISRFGLVSWVLARYGTSHGLNGWVAYRSLRRECKTGVALLVGMNGIWWLGLVRKIIRTSALDCR